LTEALQMADSSEETDGMDPLLGVAAKAVD